MWTWLGRNADKLQALGAIVTAVAAFIALIVIPMQISSADLIQRDQTAREIYREFLNLTVQKPELASGRYCAMTDENQRVAYEAYVDYLFYTAEQMIESDPEWKGPMASYFEDHLEFICSRENRGRFTQGVAEIAATLQSQCARSRAARRSKTMLPPNDRLRRWQSQRSPGQSPPRSADNVVSKDSFATTRPGS